MTRKLRLMIVCLVCAVCLCGCAPTVAEPVTTTAPVTTVTTTTSTELTTTSTETSVATTTGSTTARPRTSTTATPTIAKTTVTTTTTTTTTTRATTIATTTVTTTGTTQKPAAPIIEGEIRATWISYIELSELLRACKTPADAEKAIDDWIGELADIRINTIFFHVRVSSNAYYPSDIFKPAAAAKSLIKAGFDPLACAVTAAHKRGVQLHAWVNPYRAGSDKDYLVDGVPYFKDKTGRYYYVPTDQKAQRLILNGVRELFDNYDIDGVHYDDYFYPEGLLEETKVETFEKTPYAEYQKNGGTLSVGDWRRAGVDALVAGTYAIAQSHGKIFGISPAHDADKTHDKLFADPRRWIKDAGYVHYLCPQIYFGFENSTAAFDAMTERWLSYDRHPSVELYIGMAAYKIGLKQDAWAGDGKTEWATHTDILKRQVQYLRGKGIRGLCFYSASFFKPETAIAGDFKKNNKLDVAKQEIQNLLTVL